MDVGLTLSIIERAIEVATAQPEETYSDRIIALDEKIHRLEEQHQSRPSVPTELQDSYREEIDAVTLENMQLSTNLEQTQTALKRAKEAYKEEVKHTSLLEHKLDDLEQRLVSVLRKGAMN